MAALPCRISWSVPVLPRMVKKPSLRCLTRCRHTGFKSHNGILPRSMVGRKTDSTDSPWLQCNQPGSFKYCFLALIQEKSFKIGWAHFPASASELENYLRWTGKDPRNKKVLTNLTISHAYTSTYSIDRILQISISWKDGYSSELDNSGISFPSTRSVRFLHRTVQPADQIRYGWVNSLFPLSNGNAHGTWLQFDNDQLTNLSNEIIIGLDIAQGRSSFFFSLGAAGKKSKYKSDLNIKADFSIARNMTVLRQLDQTINQISTGQQVITIILPSITIFNQRFNLRFLFNKIINSLMFQTNTIPQHQGRAYSQVHPGQWWQIGRENFRNFQKDYFWCSNN